MHADLVHQRAICLAKKVVSHITQAFLQSPIYPFGFSCTFALSMAANGRSTHWAVAENICAANGGQGPLEHILRTDLDSGPLTPGPSRSGSILLPLYSHSCSTLQHRVCLVHPTDLPWLIRVATWGGNTAVTTCEKSPLLRTERPNLVH